MEIIIAITLLVISAIGLLAALGLFIGFIANSRSDSDLYLSDYDCPCNSCTRDLAPIDACSSECDDACAANQHCSAPDPWCGCESCTNHRLDELPPRTTNE
jgi:hypothetical protein